MRSIFVSYARDDRFWRDCALDELKPLIDERRVEIFHDEILDGGQLWEKEILGRIKGSDGFLILGSKLNY